MLLKSTHVVARISSYIDFVLKGFHAMDLLNVFTIHQLMEIWIAFRFLSITKKPLLEPGPYISMSFHFFIG